MCTCARVCGVCVRSVACASLISTRTGRKVVKEEKWKSQSKAHLLDQTRNFRAVHRASKGCKGRGGGMWRGAAIMYAAI